MPAYPVSEAEAASLRNRRRTSGVPDADVGTHGRTIEQAVRYNPGNVKVRLTALRDVIAVLRSRYMDIIFRLSSALLLIQLILSRLGTSTESFGSLLEVPIADACSRIYAELAWLAPAMLLTVVSFLTRRSKSVYLVDFALFEPPAEWRASKEELLRILENVGRAEDERNPGCSFAEGDIEFMGKVLGNSGTGDATAWPPGIHRCREPGVRQDQSMEATRQEAETVVCSCLEGLFAQTGVTPKEVDLILVPLPPCVGVSYTLHAAVPPLGVDRITVPAPSLLASHATDLRAGPAAHHARRLPIVPYLSYLSYPSYPSYLPCAPAHRAQVDFLIINCSLFSPTPSLCAMACNKFRMRSNIRTFNLSGQGCSASLLAVDLASELLQNNPGSVAVVVSTELITQSLYHGHEKAFLLQNTLFRCGGAAICLTNRSKYVAKARYRLRHLVRTQCSDDESYRAVYQCEDGSGLSGVRLSKEIVKVALPTRLSTPSPLPSPLPSTSESCP